MPLTRDTPAVTSSRTFLTLKEATPSQLDRDARRIFVQSQSRGRLPELDTASSLSSATTRSETTKEKELEELRISLTKHQEQLSTLATELSSAPEDEKAGKFLELWSTIQEIVVIQNCIASLEIDTGMTIDHFKSIQDTAIRNQMVMIWRPTNPEAAGKLKFEGAVGKNLFTKAKSSTFAPIAGLIPVDVKLSKLFADPSRLPSEETLKHYQDKVHTSLHMFDEGFRFPDATPESVKKSHGASHESLAALTELFEKGEPIQGDAKIQKVKTQIEQLREMPPQTAERKIYKEGDAEYPMSYIIPAPPSEPIFLIQRDEGYFAYNPRSKKFDTRYSGDGEPEDLMVLAYQDFYLDDDNVLRKISRVVTGDYDLLTVASRKIHPLYTAGIAQIILGKEILRDLLTEDRAPEDFRKQLLFAIEKKNLHDLISLISSGSMGFVNEEQQVAIASLYAATDRTVSHGPETNNVFPESFSEDESYVAFLPDGEVILLKGQQNILEFIGEQRKLGFPLPINPKWGWEYGSDGELTLPASETALDDWQKLNEHIVTISATANVIAKKYNQKIPAIVATPPTDELRKKLVRHPKRLTPEEKDRLEFFYCRLARDIIEDLTYVEILLTTPRLHYSKVSPALPHLFLLRRDRELHTKYVTEMLRANPEILQETLSLARDSEIDQTKLSNLGKGIDTTLERLKLYQRAQGTSVEISPMLSRYIREEIEKKQQELLYKTGGLLSYQRLTELEEYNHLTTLSTLFQIAKRKTGTYGTKIEELTGPGGGGAGAGSSTPRPSWQSPAGGGGPAPLSE